MTFDPSKYDFRLVELPPNNAMLVRLRRAYLDRFHLPGDADMPGKIYYALLSNEMIVLVLGVYPRPDRGIEIADFYAVPSREGVQACYYVLEYVKAAVNAKHYPYVITSTIAKNTTMQRRIAKVYGAAGKPIVYVYKYPPLGG